MLESELSDVLAIFLIVWPFESHFSYKLFSYKKKRVQSSAVLKQLLISEQASYKVIFRGDSLAFK